MRVSVCIGIAKTDAFGRGANPGSLVAAAIPGAVFQSPCRLQTPAGDHKLRDVQVVHQASRKGLTLR